MNDNNREENGFEAYIEREFIDNTEEFELPAERKKSFRIAFGYALAFVMVLIVFGVTGTYAYYNVEVQNSSETTALNASASCFNVTLSDNGTYSLQYPYPITDYFATNGANITPMTVTVTNNCQSGDAIPYKLYLTTLPSSDSNIPDGDMKINVKKDNIDVVATKLISSLTSADPQKDTIKKAIQEKGDSASGLVDGNYYEILTNGSVEPNKTDTYSFTFWIDYKEGESNNSTASKKFSAIVSAIIN